MIKKERWVGLPEGHLEIQQDLAFQFRHWRRERIGWIGIALTLLAGLFGLFGHHPLARVTGRTADGQLTIDYDRYARYESNAQLAVTIKPDREGDGKTYLWFEAAYLDSIHIIAVSPLPLRGEAREGERAFIDHNRHVLARPFVVQ